MNNNLNSEEVALSKNAKQIKILKIIESLNLFQMFVTFPAKMEILLPYVNGNTNLYQLYNSRSMTFASAFSMISNPLLAQLSNIFGRKQMIHYTSCYAFLSRCIPGIFPTGPAILVLAAISGAANTSMYSTTMIGDIMKGDPKKIANLQAELLGVRAIVFVFGPVLGAVLAKNYGIRSVFALSSIISASQIYLTTFLKETLSEKMRMSRIDYSKIVPWNFLKLMFASTKSFITCILYMVTKATDGRAIGQIGTLVRTEQYDTNTFGIMERSYIAAYQTFCMIPGYMFARKIFATMSVFNTFLVGHIVLIVQKYVQSILMTLRMDYFIMTLAVAKPIADVSVINMLRKCGKQCGFGIAELEGMISNLEETSYALAAPFWAMIYSNALQHSNDSRLFHRGVYILLLIQIGMGFVSEKLL